ncbi:MAG: imidazolonepropionase [Balneolaceae bacterium]|nr:imidazolonepropionase [Balneolaceae bacterium]MBO6545364.1 imidazolonepropionase [Balneolaceae bacterium]MBO6646760.1 imidazolonepropionase [Balneolaceae bacterium]
MNSKTLYGPFTQLLTMEGLPLHGPLKDEELQVQRNQGVLVNAGVISEVDMYDTLAQKYPEAKRNLYDHKNLIALPAFIDCHTHICWGGSRINDYALRVAGKSYLEIAAAGGGIMDTVTATRSASEEELIKGILKRANQHISQGIATIEVKSGYGLSLNDELKMLECIKEANEQTEAELIPTFLGAHIKPKEFDGSHKEYLDFLLREVVPEIKEKGLAKRADIFVEEGAFGTEESREYAEKLIELGFDMTMHVDQFHPGGSKIANETGCVSADHLEFTDDKGVEVFNNSKTVAVALPGASLGLGMKFTPARKLLDGGASLAIATDWNPGSAPMGDLITQASVLGASEKLTIAETLAAITFRAAFALRIEGGVIKENNPAAFTVFETQDFRDIFYQQGQLKPAATIIKEKCFEF